MSSSVTPPLFYAHTSKLKNGKTNSDKSTWEPLFTPFGQISKNDPSIACSGKNGNYCPHCENLEPKHGHLNKVAYLCSKFAAKMLPKTPDREQLRQWGFVTGIWHDFGKFSEEFQTYLNQSSDLHSGEIQGKVDHTSAGAKLATNHFTSGAYHSHSHCRTSCWAP